jgi:hypothetical protein
MISAPSLVTTLIGMLALVPLLGPGGPDPGVAIAARALLVDRAVTADAALEALEAAIAPGLDAARTGAARVVAGEAPPGEALLAAARQLTEADSVAARAAAAVRSLEGARRAAEAGGTAIEVPVEGGDLASIGAQVEGTAAAADRFAEMRLRADRVLVELGTAIDALDAGDVADAREAIARAREHHDAVAAWEIGLVTLPIWTDAAGALLMAAQSLLDATAAGDASAVQAAARALDAQADDARSADRALRIAMAEGGGSVTAAPLARLADLLRATAEARVAVAEILHEADR